MKKTAKALFVFCVMLSLGGCGHSSSIDSGSFKDYVKACDSQWDNLNISTNQLVQLIDNRVIDSSSAINSVQQMENTVDHLSESYTSLAVPDNRSMQSIAQQIQDLDRQEHNILQDLITGLNDHDNYVISDVGNQIIQEFKESLDVRDVLVKLSNQYGVAWTPAH